MKPIVVVIRMLGEIVGAIGPMPACETIAQCHERVIAHEFDEALRAAKMLGIGATLTCEYAGTLEDEGADERNR